MNRAPYEYVIPAKRLLEITILRGTMYFWLPQIADKAWADFDAFLDAYKHALDVHVGKYPGTIDPEMMERSIQYARGKIAQR